MDCMWNLVNKLIKMNEENITRYKYQSIFK